MPKLHEEWLEYALRDLMGAKGMTDLLLYELALYHTQQSIEKSLKAFLVFQHQSIPKTHDLEKLIFLCVDLDTEFDKFATEMRLVNGLDVTFRYPRMATFVPNLLKVQECIEIAIEVFDFVTEKCK